MIRSKILSVALFLIALTGLLSCSPVNFKPLFKSRNDLLTDTLKTTKVLNPDPAAYPGYRIQPGDVLDIHSVTIDRIESSSGATGTATSAGTGATLVGFRVELDGYVILPKLDGKSAGRAMVAGLNRKEATDLIQGMYRSLFVDQVIDVSVVSPRVVFLGEFASPGTYFLDKDNISVVEVLGTAGGFSARADPQTLKIIRNYGASKTPEIIYVNLQDLNTLSSSRIILQNKDLVYVEPNRKFIQFDKSQSSIGVLQTALVLVTTGLLVYTSFFK